MLLLAFLPLLESCYCWHPFWPGVSTIIGVRAVVGIHALAGVQSLLFSDSRYSIVGVSAVIGSYCC
jgi:hypothetical protein